jgi:hypothetical protein
MVVKASILVWGCTEQKALARGILSTVSGDNFAEKISGGRIFPCFLTGS